MCIVLHICNRHFSNATSLFVGPTIVNENSSITTADPLLKQLVHCCKQMIFVPADVLWNKPSTVANLHGFVVFVAEEVKRGEMYF